MAFDGHGPARAEAGVIGHAVNRSVRNPNVVVIYLQAESLEALRAFAASPDLKQVMQAAGVVGAPDLASSNARRLAELRGDTHRNYSPDSRGLHIFFNRHQ